MAGIPVTSFADRPWMKISVSILNHSYTVPVNIGRFKKRQTRPTHAFCPKLTNFVPKRIY